MPTLIVAFAATALAAPLVRRLLRRLEMFDLPGDRSLHVDPILRGGGMAVALGVALATLVRVDSPSRSWWALLAVPIVFAVVGWADDRRSRSVTGRLLAQTLLAAIAAALLASGDLDAVVSVGAAIVAAAWIVSYVNVFNFMDGINGISAVTAGIAGAAYWSIGERIDNELLSLGGTALVGGALAFLPFNFPSARMFLGDVGSYFMGSYLAILAVIALRQGASPVSVAAPLALYVVDASVTLVRRWRRGEKVWEPHRSHVYQQLAQAFGHTMATLTVAVATGLASAIGLVALDRGTAVGLSCGAGLAVVMSGYLVLPSVFDRASVSESAR